MMKDTVLNVMKVGGSDQPWPLRSPFAKGV